MNIITNPISKKDLTGQQYMDQLYWRNRIAETLRLAADHGVVITVSNPPRQPLMMGNYDLVVDSRQLRNYKGG